MLLQTCITFFCWTQKKIFWKMLVIGFGCHWHTLHLYVHIMEVNGKLKQFGLHSSKYLLFCYVHSQNKGRFGTTQEWVNDRIKCFGWTILLNTYIFTCVSATVSLLEKKSLVCLASFSWFKLVRQLVFQPDKLKPARAAKEVVKPPLKPTC